MEDKITTNDLIDINLIDKTSDDLSNKLINESDADKIKNIVDLFNLNQAKKEILRVDSYNKLVDKLVDQMSLRLDKKADEFSNKDLIDYLKVISDTTDKSKKAFSTINDMPAIQINQVNIGDNSEKELSRESREKVMAAINAYMKKAMQSQEQESQEIVIDNDGEDV